MRDKNGKLMNCPYVDNSYKWAGGGFLSSIGDLVKIGNTMLYCYGNNNQDNRGKGTNTFIMIIYFVNLFN